MWPWLDSSGRFSALKLAVLIALAIPAAMVAADAVMGALGPRPFNTALRPLGLWSIRFLFIAMAVTPLAAAWRWPQLFELRRMIGVAAAVYIVAHLVLYTGQEMWRVVHVAGEIVSRIYLAIGFTALTGLVALGVTSTDGMMRRMGRNWGRLHRAIYVIAPLAAVHFFMQSKANVTEPMLMMGLYAWLMGWRLMAERAPRRRPSARAVAAMGAAAAVLTALGEALYFYVKMGASPWLVLALNVNTAIGWRPAWGVAAVAAVVPLGMVLRGLAARRVAPA